MNLPKMIAELRAERDRLDQAILALERLSVSNARHRAKTGRWQLPGENETDKAAQATPETDLIAS